MLVDSQLVFYKINKEWKVVVRERCEENFSTLTWKEKTFGANPNIFLAN